MLIRDLTKFANDLDSSGLKREADTVDVIIDAVKRLLDERSSRAGSSEEGGEEGRGHSKEDDSEEQVDLFGYKTSNFEICPGAVKAFSELKEELGENPDDKTGKHALDALRKTDDLFQIEKNAINSKSITTRELEEAIRLHREILYNIGALSSESDKELLSSFEFLDGHMDKIIGFKEKGEKTDDK